MAQTRIPAPHGINADLAKVNTLLAQGAISAKTASDLAWSVVRAASTDRADGGHAERAIAENPSLALRAVDHGTQVLTDGPSA